MARRSPQKRLQPVQPRRRRAAPQADGHRPLPLLPAALGHPHGEQRPPPALQAAERAWVHKARKTATMAASKPNCNTYFPFECSAPTNNIERLLSAGGYRQTFDDKPAAVERANTEKAAQAEGAGARTSCCSGTASTRTTNTTAAPTKNRKICCDESGALCFTNQRTTRSAHYWPFSAFFNLSSLPSLHCLIVVYFYLSSRIISLSQTLSFAN